MSVAKTAHDIMLSSGMLTYFSMTDLVNITKGSVDVVGSTMDNAWNKREDTFRQSGESIGEVIGSAAMGAANVDLLYHSAKKMGWQEAVFGELGSKFGPKVTEAKGVLNGKGNGYIYDMLEGGGFKYAGKYSRGTFTPFTGTAKTINESSRLGKFLGSGKSVEGVLHNGSKFVKGQSMMRGFAPFIGAFAVSYAAKSILGFAGGIVDEAMRDYARERRVHYDNRFFNSQRDEMSNYQTLGAAMNNYENRMMSTSRIYHSR